ncbi:MAG: SAM-dependent methyltransferase [Magnetovibrio sp.]|nr:SAM-dependent methyltransferase [Magnetovibrio sp.]
MAISARLDFPSTQRNAKPIIEVLRTLLPAEGKVVEIASGSGQHIMRFAQVFPGLVWQPTDIEPEHLRSIGAWTNGLKNVMKPYVLDASALKWPIERSSAVICINMLHIAPWEATVGLFVGASKILDSGGLLYLYGPYKIDGQHTSESNACFDADLKSRDSTWGLRDVSEIIVTAAEVGLKFDTTIQMPSNNLSLIFKKPVRPPSEQPPT